MYITVKNYLIGLSLILVTICLVSAFATQLAHAGDAAELACQGISGNGCDSAPGEQSIGAIVGAVVNILSYIVGAASVIVIIIAGLRYITSGGDAAGVKGAKNTIMYALIGLAVAIFAQVILNVALSAENSNAQAESTIIASL